MMAYPRTNGLGRIFPLSALATCLALTGCGGSSNDNGSSSTPPATRSISVSPSLGQINNADVILKQVSTGTILGTQNTGSSGQVTFNNIAANSGALAIEVKPTATSTYFDEATAKTVPFPTTAPSLHALATLSGNANVGVTAWTEAAYQRALALAGSNAPSVAQINQANTELSTQAGLNILTAPTLIDSSADLAALKANVADAYALSLAALAKQAGSTLGSSETAPALQAALKLAADAIDGKIDGKGLAGATIANLPYNASSFIADFSAQISTLISSLNLATGSGSIGDLVKPKPPTVTPPPTGTGLTLSGSETGTFSPASSSTMLEGGETVYRFATANNAASIAVYVAANGSVRLANFIDSNSAYECSQATCAGISIAGGKVVFNNATLANGLKINGNLSAAPLTPPVTPPSNGNVISASGNVSTTLATLATFSPDSLGFSIKISSASNNSATTLQFKKGSSQIEVKLNANGSVNETSLTHNGQIYTCIENAGALNVPACTGVSLSRGSNGKNPITVAFSGTSLKAYPSGTGSITLNGSLTGDMTSAAAWTPQDLPTTTDGFVGMNNVNQAIISSSFTQTGVTGFTLQSLILNTATAQLTVGSTNGAAPTTTLSLSDTTLPANDRLYLCSTNCGVLNVTNSGVSVNLNNVVLTSLDGKKTIQLKNTIFVGRTSGTLTTDSSSLGNFSPTKSAISAFNDTLDISFDTLGTTAQAGLSLLTITLDPKTRAVSEISVSGGIGGSLYKCLVNGTGIGIPACTGVTVAANNRTVTFNNTKVVGGAALATPTTVTLNGTLNAVGR